MWSHHIIQLLRNISGNDYIIGDVHGCNAGLRAIINSLKAGDRLFIVGDLFDRGPGSVDVYNAIIEAKKNGKEIHVVRGNHEDMFLNAMSVLMDFKNDPTKRLDIASKQAIYDFLRNGGSWIFSKTEDQELYQEDMLRQTTLDDFVCDPPFFTKSLCQELIEIQSYLDSLPYIILVGDIDDKKNSFITCHAAMPFDDETLRKRLNDCTESSYNRLQPTEIRYVTWERPDHPVLKNQLYNSGRTVDSLLVYCGHSILCKYPPYKTRAYRTETRHVNLDAGAYLDCEMQMFLRMNHTTEKADVISGNTNMWPSISQCSNEVDLERVAADITKYLTTIRTNALRKTLNTHRAELRDRLKKALLNTIESVSTNDSNLEMLELQLLCNSRTELGTHLLSHKQKSIKLELVAMIHELERLMQYNDRDESLWQPGELATKRETYCCFFSRSSALNSFHDQVVNLGGISINATRSAVEQQMR